ncbi:tRNA (guanosine-2'-O-)-methyltransferase [Arachidicoccus rhizosphaerae]|uniref:tRNA (guanosine(18)-2'-O)-methyltransferase n=1 Tax=Arachidicoccus rhizosphaerae TaxID=551991 RepID=A0A1H4C010_9BACT|nr:tRNA (guanosine-2'-O-)-methyltransferase [Arachidicoccus rhizosphaerae]
MTPERLEKLKNVLLKRQFDLTVIFENVQDPHNIAAVLRTCESAGIQEVHILNHTIAPHPKFGDGLGYRSSSSAWKWLTLHYHDNIQSCVKAIRSQGFTLMATALNEKAVNLYDVDFTQKLALVFGNEKKGVSDEMLENCDGNFLIPQQGIIQSLNISVACAICIYEAYRQKNAQGHYAPKSMADPRIQKVAKQWELPIQDPK